MGTGLPPGGGSPPVSFAPPDVPAIPADAHNQAQEGPLPARRVELRGAGDARPAATSRHPGASGSRRAERGRGSRRGRCDRTQEEPRGEDAQGLPRPASRLTGPSLGAGAGSVGVQGVSAGGSAATAIRSRARARVCFTIWKPASPSPAPRCSSTRLRRPRRTARSDSDSAMSAAAMRRLVGAAFWPGRTVASGRQKSPGLAPR